MQHLRTLSATHRSLLANLLLLGNRLLIFAVLGLLLLSLFSNGHNLIYDAMLVGISVLVILAQWIATAYLGCPLCKTPVLASIGSTELPCPSCNQSSTMNGIDELQDTHTQQSEFSTFH